MTNKVLNCRWSKVMLGLKSIITIQMRRRVLVLTIKKICRSGAMRKIWICPLGQMDHHRVEAVKQNQISDQHIQRAIQIHQTDHSQALALKTVVKIIINKIKRCKFMMAINLTTKNKNLWRISKREGDLLARQTESWFYLRDRVRL